MNKHRAERPGNPLLNASLVMAVGTIFSRLTGFVKTALVAVALGVSINADVFTVANTVPNTMYILVAGGVFNVVLVPQLVRAMKHDSDGGDAYANRVVTLGLLVLLVATVVLVVVTPFLARLLFDPSLFTAEFSAERDSAYALMRYCMPQVFFYGAFVLCGQILNARGRFGPMMWAPITNNLVSGLVLLSYIAVYGSSEPDASGGFSNSAELLLGLGSTLGIAVQAAVLIPYLRKAGFRYRMRFDFRGVGLGHTIKLGVWTLLFVIVNQITYIVVNRLATASSTEASSEGTQAAGATVYQIAFLISQVPHGIITVSVFTATIPLLSSLAADREYVRMRGELVGAMRMVLVAIVPIAVAVACTGQLLATAMTSYGGLTGSTHVIGKTIIAFTPAMVLFSLQYMTLRGFYADEDTRTPFTIQIWLALTNIVAAVVLTSFARTDQVAMYLAVSYGLAYFVGFLIASTKLSNRIGAIFTPPMLGFLLRLALASAVSGVVILGCVRLGDEVGVSGDSARAAFVLLGFSGAVGAVAYVIAARLLRLREVTGLLRAIRGRG
ncbi:murein biosynthesis integral membrane protein MurJ [Solicola gregarius]|uniref:Murein biosynthesis integral membrane protein MurJ n=1 Tax=Solicola gregarius TaxID=2908642 RepID=A0AA46TLI7_9ACTN|nr:murein biosynthesis integral membrane protein MurJ [Solicola gregarius]UYM07353.1 murein biosynthesis integral membrane protein MurJ [Solicola gregarius]